MIRIKCFLLLILLSVIYNAKAQNEPNNEDGLYSGIIQIDNVTQEELYKRVHFWMLTTLKSGDNMTLLNDPDKSLLIGSNALVLSNISYKFDSEALNPYISFKVIISLKNERIKYVISNIDLVYEVEYLSGGRLIRRTVNTNLENLASPPNLLNKKKIDFFKDSIHNDAKLKLKNFILSLQNAMELELKNDW